VDDNHKAWTDTKQQNEVCAAADSVCVDSSLHHGAQILQKLWRKFSKLLEFPMKCTAVTLTLKLRIMIMADIAVSVVTLNNTNMLK
jgi:hypothetical protein